MRKQKILSGRPHRPYDIAVLLGCDAPCQLTKKKGGLALLTLLCLTTTSLLAETDPTPSITHLSGNNTYTTPFQISQDTIVSTDSSTINVLSGPLVGSGKFIYKGKDPSCRLILANQAAADFAGGFEIYEGALRTSGTRPLGYGSLAFKGGCLELVANSYLPNNIQLTEEGGSISQIWVPDQKATATLAGQISGSAPLVFNGPGILALHPTEQNSWTGGLIVNGGAVQSSGINPFGSNTFTLQNQGDLFFSENGSYGNDRFTLMAPLTIHLASNSVSDVTATFEGGHSIILEGAGGQLNLHASSMDYQGEFILNSGTLSVDKSDSLGQKNRVLFNGGTLQWNESLLLPASQFYVAERGGTIALADGTDSSFALTSTLTGNGTINFQGRGNNTSTDLSNLNASDFNGKFVVDKTTLLVSSPNNLNHRPLHLDEGQLVIQYEDSSSYTNPMSLGQRGGVLSIASPSATFSGSIDGPGSLFYRGPGELHLTGKVTHRGGVEIAGPLVKTSGENPLGTGPLVFNGGNLRLTGPSTITTPVVFHQPAYLHVETSLLLSGPLSGDNGFTLAGGGILTIPAAPFSISQKIDPSERIRQFIGKSKPALQEEKNQLNTYLGATVIESGTLKVSGYQPLGQGPLVLNTTGQFILDDDTYLPNNVLLVNDSTIQTDHGTTHIDGGIHGIGNSSLTKKGKGALVLRGVNSFTGPTHLSEGRLEIQGTLTSPLTTKPGTQLFGSGAIYAPVALSGELDLHAHRLTTENITFKPHSSLKLVLNGAQQGSLKVLGDVKIDKHVDLNLSLNPIAAANYTLLQATGNIEGRFKFASFHGGRSHVEIRYAPNAVNLDVFFDPFADLLPSGNLQNIGACFDQASTVFSPEMTAVLQTLNTLNISQLEDAFSQLDPSFYNVIQFAEEAVPEKVRNVFSQHLYERSWDCDFSNAVYVTYFKERIHQDSFESTPDKSGYSDSFNGFAIGLDHLLKPCVLAGAGFSYARSNIEWSHARKATSYLDSYTGYLGAAWFSPWLILEAYGSYTFHRADTTKNIYIAPGEFAFSPDSPFDPSSLTAIDRKVELIGNGETYTSHLGGVIRQTIDHTPFYLMAYLDVDYLYVRQHSCDEQNGGVLGLNIHRKNADLLRPESGVGFGCLTTINCEQLFFEVDLAYLGMFRFQGGKTRANFIGNDCVFSVWGLKPNHNLVRPTLRFGLISSLGWDLTFNYSGAFGNRYSENEGKVELTYVF